VWKDGRPDRVIAELAEGLPMSESTGRAEAGKHPATVETAHPARRSADLPPEVVHRPKRFPLPFQEWITDNAAALRESALSRDCSQRPR
jgi:hypothetical protein